MLDFLMPIRLLCSRDYFFQISMYMSKTSYILTVVISLEKSEWKNVARKLRNLTKWFFAKKTRNRA